MFTRIVTAALVALSALGASADTLSRGQWAAETFLAGDAAALWAAMTPQMQETLGSVDALERVRADLGRRFGAEADLLSEATGQSGAHATYTRAARWLPSQATLEIVVALDGAERIDGFRVQPRPEAAASSRLDYRTRAPLRLPFDGEWTVFWGGREIADNYHAADPAQRFALDFLVQKGGRTHAGDPAEPSSYHCWDRPVLSPADGVVASAVDGLPDQPIGSADPERPAGNHVVLDFGQGEYGFLAHLRQGSLRVAEGDHVRAGEEIGRCGNSGNTSEPHLHFHLQTTPDLAKGEGLPAQFTGYVADGRPVDRGEPGRGQTVRHAD